MAKDKVVFSVEESLRKISKSLENIPKALEEQLNQAVAETAHAAYAAIVAKAQADLHRTRQDYLKSLSFDQLDDNTFLISLDGDWANALEEGFPSYNQTEQLLRSQKIVGVGSRSGQPWVQRAKDKDGNRTGHKFAHVPFERKPFSKDPKVADMAAAIRQMKAQGKNGVEQEITKIFKDGSGNPMEGYVARGKSDNPKLDNLVKYQKNYVNQESGKITTQSVYINFRTVSENGKPWIHPGFGGLQAFPEAAKQIEEQLNNIVRILLG